jgi:hypothetical protein
MAEWRVTMTDFTISGDLASRLQAAAERNHTSVEQLISDLLELIAASQGQALAEDRAWLELSGQSFGFWENDEDAVYDGL